MILAIVSVLVSDMHAVPDLVLTLAQNSANRVILPEGFAFPYWLAGVVGEPILVLSIFAFALGLVGAWRKTGERSAKIASIVAFIYAAERVFWAIADVQYARAVEALLTTGDMTSLTLPGMLKGIIALVDGITAGIILALFLTIYFSRTKTRLGEVGGMLVLIAVSAGIVVKTASLWVWPYQLITAFLLSMVAKSVGIALMSSALYQQATSDPATT